MNFHYGCEIFYDVHIWLRKDILVATPINLSGSYDHGKFTVSAAILIKIAERRCLCLNVVVGTLRSRLFRASVARSEDVDERSELLFYAYDVVYQCCF